MSPSKKYYHHPILTHKAVGVQPLGELRKDINDIFGDGGSLNVRYNSDGYKDNYQNLGGFRPSYTLSMDKIDYTSLDIKTGLYSTEKDACENGFSEIQDDIFMSLLNTSTAKYDAKNQACKIFKDGVNVANFTLYNKNGIEKNTYLENLYEYFGIYKVKRHFITKSNGDILSFINKGKSNTFVSEQTDMKLYKYRDKFVLQDENSTISFIDTRATEIKNEETTVKLTYDLSKLAKVYYDDTEYLNFIYNSDRQIDKIVNIPENKEVHFKYENNLLTNIVLSSESDTLNALFFTYDDNSAKLIEYGINDIQLNKDIVIPSFKMEYKYNRSGLIIGIKSPVDIVNVYYSEGSVIYGFLSDDSKDVVFGIINSTLVQLEEVSENSSVQYEYNDKAELIKIIYNGEEYDTNERAMHYARGEWDVKFNKNKDMTYSSYTDNYGEKQENFIDYDDTFKKPIKIVTDKGVTLLSYNKYGNLVKKVHSKTVNNHNFRTLQSEVDYKEILYTYDNNNTLSSIYNSKLDETTLFDKKGKKLSNQITLNEREKIDEITKCYKKLPKSSFASFQSLQCGKDITLDDKAKAYNNCLFEKGINKAEGIGFLNIYDTDYTECSLEVGLNLKTRSKRVITKGLAEHFGTSMSVKDKATTQLALVGGACDRDYGIGEAIPCKDGGHKTVFKKYQKYYENKIDFNVNYYTHIDVGTDSGISDTSNQFNKTQDRLIVVGHSYGGDSALEATNAAGDADATDLLITVDPIGWEWADVRAKNAYWIELYADRELTMSVDFAWDEYCVDVTLVDETLVKWNREIINLSNAIANTAGDDISRETTNCLTNGGCEFWREKKKEFCIYTPKSITTHYSWDDSDWIAFFGGKYSYSAYDKGGPHTDQFFSYTQFHHGDFGLMIEEMQKNQKFNFDLFK